MKLLRLSGVSFRHLRIHFIFYTINNVTTLFNYLIKTRTSLKIIIHSEQYITTIYVYKFLLDFLFRFFINSRAH